MDLELAGKVAVVTGPAKASAWPSPRRWPTRARASSPGRAPRRRLDGLDGVTAVAVDLAKPDGPAALVAARDRGARPRRRAGQQRRRRAPAPRGLSRHERRRVRVGDADELLHAAARHPGRLARWSSRAAARSSTSPRSTPSSSPTRPRSTTARPRRRSSTSPSRWRRSSGRGGSTSTPSPPGPVGTDLWLGEHGVAETVAEATGVDADTARETIIAGIGGFATGRFTTPEEVATLVVLLASERTGNVTGANYVIDGGLIKTT